MSLSLKRLTSFQGRKGPLLLIIMDGVGIGRQDETNAVYLANTPNLDRLFGSELYTQLKAHGTAVGLPTDKDMGNSEVGHNALGAGRVFDQGARLVNKALDTGEIFKTDLWKKIVQRAKEGGTIHFIGLLSDGNVHSHIDQLYVLIDHCVDSEIKKVRVHALMDGRDVGEKSALDYINPTQEKLRKISDEKGFDYCIASGGGRMKVTMDRYNADWNIVKRGWEAHVLGKGRYFHSALDAVNSYYDEDPHITDQYMAPFVIVDDTERPVGPIIDGDSVIFFNFRGDRAIQISQAFDQDNFKKFEKKCNPKVNYYGLLRYDEEAKIPEKYFLESPNIENTIVDYLSAEKVPMFAVSETFKFGHVQYFFEGNRDFRTSSRKINKKNHQGLVVVCFGPSPLNSLKGLNNNTAKFGGIVEAAGPGFEPGLSVPETDVLPLDDPAINGLYFITDMIIRLVSCKKWGK